MSIVTGLAPIVHSLNITGGAPNSTNPFTDTMAVNYLLNVTNSTWMNNSSVNMLAASHNLLLSQSANKSVNVFYNSQSLVTTTNVTGNSITPSNVQSIDAFAFNQASIILTTESFEFQTVPPASSVINNNSTYGLSLASVPASQNDVNALNDLRILNQANSLSPGFSINYSATNVSNALGVEAKAYFYNGTMGFSPYYNAIASANLVSENNIAMSFAAVNNATYVYELQKIAYAAPTFNASGTSQNVVSTFGGSSLSSVNSLSVSGAWVQVQLNAASVVASYKLQPTSNNGYLMNSWVLMGSTDNVTWSVIDIQPNAQLTPSLTTFTSTGAGAAGAYSYVRIVFTGFSVASQVAQTRLGYFSMFNGSNTMLVAAAPGTGTWSSDWIGSPSGYPYFWINGAAYNDVGRQPPNYNAASGVYQGSTTTIAISSNANYSYAAFLAGAGGLNYSGQLGNNISGVLSDSLSIAMTNGMGVTSALTQASGFSGLGVNPGWVSINNLNNATQLNMTFANTMNVTLTPSAVTLNNTGAVLPQVNGTYSLSVVQASESLPMGHALDNMVLNFNSSTRYNASNAAYGTTPSIVYTSDNNGTGLSVANMQASSVFYNSTVLGGNTTNNAVANNVTSGSLGGINCFYPQMASDSFTVNSAVVSNTSNDYCMVGMIQATATMNFTMYNNASLPIARLPILYPSNADYNSSNSNWNNASFLQLDNIYGSNNQTGFGVLGGSMQTTFHNLHASQVRLALTPTDPVNTGAITTSALNNTNFMFGDASLAYANTSNNLTYNGSYVAAGPVSYESYSNGSYAQRYTLVMPTAAELASGILRVQSILVDGFSDNTSVVPLNAAPLVIPMARFNITNFCINQCMGSVPNVTNVMVSYNIVINAALSGVLPYDPSNAGQQNAMSLTIPVSYTVFQTGSQSYNYGGNVPTPAVWIQWNSSNLYTHVITLQGRLTNNDEWLDLVNYNSQFPGSYNIDLRESYDILTFSNTSLYTLNFCLYPQSNVAFTNAHYVMPMQFSPSGLSSVGYDIYSSSTNTNLLTGFGVNNISAFFASGMAVNSFNFGAVQTSPNNNSVITITNTAGLSLQVTVAATSLSAPIYFIASKDALVGVSGSISRNVLMRNNAAVMIDNGVSLTSTSVGGAVTVGTSLIQLSLNNDRYQAFAYNGQMGQSYNMTAGIANLMNGTSALIDGTVAGGVCAMVLTDVVRGYQTATYTLSRSALTAAAQFGQYSDSNSSVTPATIGNPTVITFNMAQNFGIQLALNSNPLNTTNTVFTVNKTQVAVTYTPVAGPGGRSCPSSNPNGSIQLINMVSNLGASVPWIDTLNLNNFFIAGTNNEVITYTQAPIIVSEAQPNCVVNGYNGDQAVAAAVYIITTPFSDSALVANSYNISVNQVSLQYSSAYVLRNVAKTFYATVAPVDVTISHILGTSYNSTSTVSRWLTLNPPNPQSYNLTVNGLNAPMTIAQNFQSSAFKAAGSGAWTPSNWVYSPNLYSLRGTGTSNITAGSTWNTYFSNQDLSNFNVDNITCTASGAGLNGTYSLQFQQVDVAGSLVLVSFSNAFMRETWANATYGWSAPMYTNPSTIGNLIQYELTFSLNSSNILQPVITKLASATYDSHNLGGTATMNGLGYVSQVMNVSGAWSLNVSNYPALAAYNAYPYQFSTSTATDYPIIGSVAPINVTSGSWTALSTSNIHMDLSWKVTDTNNLTAGTTLYNSIMALPNGNYQDAKVLNVFAKDQLVVIDYAGNLGMRVGPDGHLYSGDISSYTYIMNSSQNRTINGAYVPQYNSDVSLSAGQPNVYP